VTGQLLAISEDHKTDDVQPVFLSGGINDVEFDEVLDPKGPSLDAVNKAIDKAAVAGALRLPVIKGVDHGY
jgi:hypothetical protein